MDELRAVRQGPPRSGEVLATESEVRNDPAFDEELAYARIAKHFFNQFLELKIALESGKATAPKDQKNFDKEVANYKRVNAQLKQAADELVKDNKRLEEEILGLEELAQDLRRQLNEATINLGLAQEKLTGLGLVKRETDRMKREGYNFLELMSEDSRKEFEKLMQGVPYGGVRDV